MTSFAFYVMGMCILVRPMQRVASSGGREQPIAKLRAAVEKLEAILDQMRMVLDVDVSVLSIRKIRLI